MSYIIEWKENVLKDIQKIEAHISRRIVKKVEELAENPFSSDIKKLKERGDFRLRVGDYRVIFSIEKEILTILKIGHRRNVYD